MISGHATVPIAVEAIRLGAYIYRETIHKRKKYLIMLTGV